MIFMKERLIIFILIIVYLVISFSKNMFFSALHAVSRKIFIGIATMHAKYRSIFL